MHVNWKNLPKNVNSMLQEQKRELVASRVSQLHNADLFVHFISALKTESYLYAGMLSHEIKCRHFSEVEIQTIKQSCFYSMLNGVFDEPLVC